MGPKFSQHLSDSCGKNSARKTDATGNRTRERLVRTNGVTPRPQGWFPDVVLNKHSGRSAIVFLSSVLVQSLLLPLQASQTRTFGLSSGGR